MDIEVFRQYVELARTLNFSKASKRLNIAQPTLSRNIAQLESFVGAQLLVRKREMIFTPIGKVVLKYANNITQQQERMLDDVKTMRKTPECLLTVEDVSYMPTLSNMINEAFSHVRRHRPYADMHFKLISGKSIKEALLDGDLDIAFSWRFFSDHSNQDDDGSGDDGRIVHVQIESYENAMVVMIPKGSPLAQRESVSIKDLAPLEFYRPANISLEHLFTSFENVCAHHGVTLDYRLVAAESLYDLFYQSQGDCAFLLSTSMLNTGNVPQSVLDQLVPVSLADVDLRWNLYVVYNTASKNPNIPPFVEHLTARESTPRVALRAL
jgi:DNA-binding transcriptional LysR family regulator